MNLNNKVKSFTIIEVIVSMTVGVITIFFAYMAFTIITENFSRTQKQYYYYSEILQFKHVFKNDLEKSINLEVVDEYIKMDLIDGIIILYDIQKDYTTRTNNNSIDTFYLKLGNLQTEINQTPPHDIQNLAITIFINDREWNKLVFYKESKYIPFKISP